LSDIQQLKNSWGTNTCCKDTAKEDCVCGNKGHFCKHNPCSHNDALLEQWEPKVHKILQTTFVIGMDREDIAQELRSAILKAATYFNSSKGVIFHTYLHNVMINTIRTLIAKAKKKKKLSEAYSIFGTTRFRQGTVDNGNNANPIANAIAKALIDERSSSFIKDLELDDIIERAKLSEREYDYIELRTEGLTMDRISEELGDSAYRIRSSIQRKIKKVDPSFKYMTSK